MLLWFLFVVTEVCSLSDIAFYPIDPSEWPCVSVQRLDMECDLYLTTQCDYVTQQSELNFTATPLQGWEVWRACAGPCPANTTTTSRQIGCKDDAVSIFDQSASMFRNSSEYLSWSLSVSLSCETVHLVMHRDMFSAARVTPLFVVFHTHPTAHAFSWDTANQTVKFELPLSTHVYNSSLATIVGESTGSILIPSLRYRPSCLNQQKPTETESAIQELRTWSLAKVRDQVIWDALYFSVLLAFYLQGFHLGIWHHYPATAAVAHATIASIQVPYFVVYGYSSYVSSLATAFALCYTYTIFRNLLFFVLFRQKHFRLPSYESITQRRDTLLYATIYYIIQIVLMYKSD